MSGDERSARADVGTTAPGPEDPVVPAMRGVLGLAAVLVFFAGVQLFLFPHDTDTRFAWTIPVPMTAVFLGASYWAAVALEASAATARTWSVARVAVPAVFVFTTLTFVDTMVHLHRFHIHMEDAAVATRAAAWAWIAIYTTVPVLLVLAWWLQRRAGTAVSAPSGLPPLLRGMLAVLAVVLVSLGTGLFVGTALLEQPGWAEALWPWPVTPIIAGAIGAWAIGLGVAAGHSWLIDDAPSLRPIGVTGVAFGVLQTVALLRFGDALDWSSVAGVGYVVGLAAVTVVGAWLLIAARRPAGRGRQPRDPG